MFGNKTPSKTPEERLGAALERYLEEVVNPDNRRNMPDENDSTYKEAVEKFNDFSLFIMETQVDKILTPNQIRFFIVNFLITSFSADSLRRTDTGLLVNQEEWGNLYPDRPFPAS